MDDGYSACPSTAAVLKPLFRIDPSFNKTGMAGAIAQLIPTSDQCCVSGYCHADRLGACMSYYYPPILASSPSQRFDFLASDTTAMIFNSSF